MPEIPSTSSRWLDERFRSRFGGGDALAEPGHCLKRWQAAKLAETLQWAAERSPWYKRLFRDLPVKELCRALKTGADPEEVLPALPFTTADDLAADSDSFLAVSHSEIDGVVTVPTSGTSGAAKRIRATADDQQETVEFFEYGMRFLVEPGQARVALAMSPARPGNVADLLGRALSKWGIPFMAFGFAPEDQASFAEWAGAVSGWRPSCLVGVPAQMLRLTRFSPLALTELETILLSGDVAGPELVSFLERAFKAKVFRHYGATETGLGGAVECRERVWPHLRDDLLVETIDSLGNPLCGSEAAGEIVVTTLTRRAMPLLRYRSGDEGALLAAPCACGSVLPRLRTFGRLADRFTLPDGRRLRLADFEAPLLKFPYIAGFDLNLREEPFTFKLILYTGGDIPADAETKIREAVISALGQLKLEIEPAHVRSLPANGGKRRLIRSNS